MQKYIEQDFDTFCENDTDELYCELIRDSNVFEGTNVHQKKKHEDKSLNNYGNILTDFLKFNNMYILNDRTKGDGNGSVKSKSVCSAIALFITTISLLS